MAVLFGKAKSTINEHILNIFSENVKTVMKKNETRYMSFPRKRESRKKWLN